MRLHSQRRHATVDSKTGSRIAPITRILGPVGGTRGSPNHEAPRGIGTIAARNGRTATIANQNQFIRSYPFNPRNPWYLHAFFYARDRFEIAESIPDHGSHR